MIRIASLKKENVSFFKFWKPYFFGDSGDICNFYLLEVLFLDIYQVVYEPVFVSFFDIRGSWYKHQIRIFRFFANQIKKRFFNRFVCQSARSKKQFHELTITRNRLRI